VAFILLLGALYVISGGIVVRGTLSGTPGVNTGLLAMGAVLASLIGTTGAAMVLVRPLLRANSVRRDRSHVVVFFIFVVANAGGLLTPLGDPPLFLGFLRGVPFLWTLRLLPIWLAVNGVLLAVFFAVDSTLFRREDLETPGDLDEVAVAHATPVRIAGGLNFLWLAAVVGVLVVAGTLRLPPGVQEAGLLLAAALSWATTPRALREENRFGFAPIAEVAAIFAGIFATMVPALAVLNARGGALGLHTPAQFFWASGLLSSFLDNAPTYLTFASVGSGLSGTDAAHLGALVAHPSGSELLVAVSAGSVLMGANTYIGNGPNFMVKAIAELHGVAMPGFFRYMLWSGVVLLPLFAGVTLIFFR
jgi:Na+/H+ antiporter NhaD/arsenite permease-like protein